MPELAQKSFESVKIEPIQVHLYECPSPPSIEEIENFSSLRWNEVLKTLLNVETQSSSPIAAEALRAVKSFCQTARLLRDGKITSSGYEYLLRNRQRQVWLFVTESISTLKSSEQALSLLFMLSYCEVGKGYSMDALTLVQKQLIVHLSYVGIIYLPLLNATKFYPSKISLGLIFQGDKIFRDEENDDFRSNSLALFGVDAPYTSISSSDLLTPSNGSRELEIIVQTNCQVVAYSSSELHIAMLQLFVDVNMRFPNMVTGRITRDRIKDAYRMGMRADQILTFLSSHAHPKVADRNPIIPDNVSDQLVLWEAENSRLRFQNCVVLELDKIGVSHKVFQDLVAYAEKRLRACLWANNDSHIIALTPDGYLAFKDYAQDIHNL